MRNDNRFIDADAHVVEPNDLFEKYLEPKFREWIPEAWANYAGNPLAFGFKIVIATPNGTKQVMPFGNDPMSAEALERCGGAGFDPGARVALPGHDEAYAEFAREDFPPRMYPVAMDRAGIDYMVVYPTVGLLSTAATELAPDAAAAIRRAYNNWLHDFCSETGGRVFGAASVDLRDAEEAAHEARRCVKEFGFKAVHVNPVWHPRLRVVHLESGAGWVPFWMDRLAASVQGGFRGLGIPGLKHSPADYFRRQCFISADPDDPFIKQTIEMIGDGNIVTATDFAHPEGRRYESAVKEFLELPEVALESKRKIMWDNALRLYPISAA